MQGADILVEELMGGLPVQVRAQHTIKTDMNGRYSLTGLSAGRVRISIMVNKQPVITKGEKVGDEIWTVPGLLTVDFNLGKGTATAKISN